MTEEVFIKSVENVIPNPPFRINIHTTSHQQVRDENSFKSVKTTSLKDYSWDYNENIKIIEIPLDGKEDGIIGSASIAILERHGMPVENIDLTSIDITVENENYTLEKKLWVSTNSITQESNSITINDDGGIKKDSSTRELTISKSRISLHGIEVPSSLFPESWRRTANQVKISFPFPMILIVDVCGKRDLDLNSPRTEIIISEKWFNFEEQLAVVICSGLSKLVTKEYWTALKKIFERSTNEVFLNALKKVK